ncbi:aldo/keto reductase [Limosilactobacillus sp. STM2_1]|uniref:Aldo/keto reductase n=1 Tax=Limosilactobacillus rudii TaxID=2759755 RepID=A0A7W3UJ67_9LACO|nr:aldo/keto reductase [Limosilactobacillus rudii]MBB1080038.1 aldo/keto reductase [Limosilactobacillus rudii]MBB1096474.1 aldo/keto reductase [Limosilactobacillus rudii]MCD7133525.1 aldo/keto reductase [Limosilactobacillus rudii]
MKNVIINNVSMPAIGIGTWHMGDSLTNYSTEIKAIQTAIDAGARAIDTAEMYGDGRSEKLVGAAIKPYNREKLFLIDKVLPSNASKIKLEHSLDQSLTTVGTDYFDLYLLHWRGGIPLAETVNELERVKQAGKIKAWGVSNFDVTDLEEMWRIKAGKNCAANEDLYNLDERGIEYDLLPLMKKHHLPLIAYSPLSQGDNISGKLTTNSLLKEIAANHHATVEQIMLAWVLRIGNVLAIPKSGTPKHAKENVEAGNIELSDEEILKLQQAFPSPNHKQPLAVI